MIDPADIELIHNNVPFTRLRGKSVLITGGSGFVGRWMSLVPEYVHVTALNHLQYDYSGWERQDWDYIIHLAPVLPERVILTARQTGASVLYTSSGAAVVDDEPGEYALGKQLAEGMLLDSGVDVKIARLYTFAGAYCNRPHFALARMIYAGMLGEPLRYNTKITRSYLYAADMAIWLWRILLDGPRGCVYDVGATRPVNMRTLALEVCQHFGTPCAPVAYTMDDPRPYYVPAQACETMDALSVRQYTPFHTAIAKTVASFKKEMGHA